MTFSWRWFFRTVYMVLFKGSGTHARLTPKRIGASVLFMLLYVPFECFNWLGFLLDEIFFRGYRAQEVTQPVFIVGNPRSGTTFLQRLIAKHTQTFTCLRTWEILFAPSVTQRKIVWAIGSLDQCLGKPLNRLIRWVEGFLRKQTYIHRIGLRAPEEDEYLFLHIWSTILVGLAIGFPALIEPYSRFDEAFSAQEKERMMGYYKRCLQRHLYAHGGEQRLLSKNPYFSPKIDALQETFSDAHFIYLARNPLNVIPSYMSLSAYWWHIFCNPLEPYPFRDLILRLTQYWYHYPLARLEQLPPQQYALVNFNDMIDDPEQTVEEIYQRFEIELHLDFKQTLREEAEKAKNYESKHEYALEDMGYTRAEILNNYADVFERWGFDPNCDAL